MPRSKEQTMIFQVGKFYLVPEVRAAWGIPTRRNLTTGEVYFPTHPRWWAVVGPLHDDAEFLGFRHEHFHVDPRFIPIRVWDSERFRNPVLGYAATPISHVWPEGADEQVMLDDIDPQAPLRSWYRLRRRKCLRTQADYPEEWARSRSWYAALVAAYREVELGPPGVCPHQGADLSTFHLDADGCVTCPLHGLRWHMETGRLAVPPLQSKRDNAIPGYR